MILGDIKKGNDYMNRLWNVITLAALIVVAAAGAGITYLVTSGEISKLRSEAAALHRDFLAANQEVIRLSHNTATGGGVNVKMMPDPDTGDMTVALDEIFSFDSNHAFCLVYSNPQAFSMPTFKMGNVVIDANQFYMSMFTTSIEQVEIDELSDGSRQVIMRGGLDCATEVGQADTTIGSRTATEHATYEITAIDRGIGGGEAGDTFAFKVFFDEDEAPINFAIFGPEFVFTGEMTEGEVTVVKPKRP